MDLSVVIDKVATSLSIQFGIESAPSGCITSYSGVIDVFGRQYGFRAVVEGCRREVRIREQGFEEFPHVPAIEHVL